MKLIKRATIKNVKMHSSLLIMLVLPLSYYIIFHYWPMYGAQIAFRDFKFLKGILGSKWIGLDNFRKMFEGLGFEKVFLNTIIISFLKLIFGYPTPIIFSIL